MNYRKLGTLLMLVLFVALPVEVVAEEVRKVRLRSGTVVSVKTQEQLSGGALHAGQEVFLLTATAVVVDGARVIAAGAPVIGFVQDSRDSQMAGVAGQLLIALRSATAVDGTSVPLSGQFIARGDDQVGRNVAVGLILCPFVLLDKGGQAVIPSGAEVRAMTIGDFEITVPAKSASLRGFFEGLAASLGWQL